MHKKKKDKSSSKKKSKRRERSRSPPAIPIEFATEEMPEDAVMSASDEEGKNGAAVSGVGSNGRGILDMDNSALHNVDLSVPVGEDEHLPRAKPYMKPEELRQYEDELAQRRRVEAMQAKKEKKEKKSKKKEKEEEGKSGSKSKSSKKSKSKKDVTVTSPEEASVQEPVQAVKSPLPKSVSPTRTMAKEEKEEATAAAVVTEKKSKKSKTGKSSKKSLSESSPSKKTPKAPVIVEFPARTNIDLIHDDHIAVTYDIELSKSSIETAVAPGNEPASDPTVSVILRVQNRSTARTLSNVRATLADSFDVRLGGADAGKEGVSLPHAIEAQATGELPMELLVMGRVRYELRVMGTLSYELDGGQQEESIEFNFAVPPSLFMLAIPRLTGADFSKVLTERIENFSATGSATMQLAQGTTGQDELFWVAVEKVTSEVTHTHVVEVVDGAASFFGQSWQGYQVAGLIKVMKSAPSDEDDHKFKTVEVEMKCTDQTFVDGLVQEIQAVEYY
ncbi:hypothetical protein BGZ94_003311 [Podila epigama]|nr:hypothetical protein BGZ94_003311 [Podila epigama]